MLRLTIVLHVIIAPRLVGVLIFAVMTVPSLQDDLGKCIAVGSAVGCLVEVPVSLMAGRANAVKVARA